VFKDFLSTWKLEKPFKSAFREEKKCCCINLLIYVGLQDASKKLIFNTIFSAYYFLKVHLHHFSKIKRQKESQNRRNQGFSYYFCMMIEGSGSGSGRPKNMWIRWIRIRIQIRNTAKNDADPQ
jgi:hypothetical protein